MTIKVLSIYKSSNEYMYFFILSAVKGVTAQGVVVSVLPLGGASREKFFCRFHDERSLNHADLRGVGGQITRASDPFYNYSGFVYGGGKRGRKDEKEF